MNKNALFDSVLWTWYEPLAKIYRTEQRKNFFPVLLPTLLTNALKIRVTLFRALKNRDVLCRNSHKVILKVAAEEKHDVSFPQKMCVPQILSLQQSELWSRPSLLPCTFMCQSSAITLRNMELKVCSSLGDFLVIAFVQAWFHVCSLKLHLRILEVFLYAPSDRPLWGLHTALPGRYSPYSFPCLKSHWKVWKHLFVLSFKC